MPLEASRGVAASIKYKRKEIFLYEYKKRYLSLYISLRSFVWLSDLHSFHEMLSSLFGLHRKGRDNKLRFKVGQLK